MPKNACGYGRYKDDPDFVGCPRAGGMTPCVARDGQTAVADDGNCVGCGEYPAHLLMEIVREVTDPEFGMVSVNISDEKVDRLSKVMHDAYEAAAPQVGWRTQEASRKPWTDVPDENKAVMSVAVKALLSAIDSGEAN